jgi:hypothetical protein
MIEVGGFGSFVEEMRGEGEDLTVRRRTDDEKEDEAGRLGSSLTNLINYSLTSFCFILA